VKPIPFWRFDYRCTVEGCRACVQLLIPRLPSGPLFPIEVSEIMEKPQIRELGHSLRAENRTISRQWLQKIEENPHAISHEFVSRICRIYDELRVFRILGLVLV
jgi:hypothetical protein